MRINFEKVKYKSMLYAINQKELLDYKNEIGEINDLEEQLKELDDSLGLEKE